MSRTESTGRAGGVPAAVYPGSFDPITNGHIDIVRRALRVFPKVTVAVGYNPNKDTAMFSPVERTEMIQEVLADVADRVVVDSFTGLLVDYVERIGAHVVIRGLRAAQDFENEFEMAMMNRHQKPHIETVFLMTDEQYFYTSSRLLKEVARYGGDVKSFLAPAVLERVRARLESPRR